MRKSWVLAATVVPRLAFAETYEVGTGKPYEEIGEVPWEALEAGDIVKINYRDAAYREKFVIGGTGTQANPITVQGVPSASGQLPVIDGDDATTRGDLDTWNEERGVVKIGGADAPAGPHEWIVIEGLDIRGATPNHSFTDHLGDTLDYRENAAALFIEDADHVTVRGCILRDSSNGLFATTLSSHLTIEKNVFRGNGLDGQVNRHNAYTEANGTLFQYNSFAPLKSGAAGNAVYDTSAGFVFRYNYVEGGSLQIELVGSEDPDVADEPTYGTSYVYGNVLQERDGDGEDVIVFWDRPGTLEFFHNTVLSRRTTTTTLFQVEEGRTVDARNNIFQTSAAGDTLALMDTTGTLTLSSNYLKDGYKPSHATFAGTITDGGGQVGGALPGFVDETTGNVVLAPDSVCRDKGGTLTGIPAEHTVAEEYAAPQSSMARPSDGPPDLGAFETVGAGGGGGDDVGDPPPDPHPDPPTDPGDDEGMKKDGGGCGCRLAGRGTGQGAVGAIALLGLALLVGRRARSRR